MKKLVVVSDTHGNLKGVEALYPLFAENEYIVHLGDGVGEARAITALYPEKTYLCAGNCDFFTAYPAEGVIEAEQVRIFYCHGHAYGVKSSLASLAQRAKQLDCTIALYGHTHTANIQELNGVTLVNPGSLSYPLGKGGSYAYIVVHKDKATPVIVGESFH